MRDPLSARSRAFTDQAGSSPKRLAPVLLGVGEVFGDLGTDPRLHGSVLGALERLYRLDSRRAVEAVR